MADVVAFISIILNLVVLVILLTRKPVMNLSEQALQQFVALEKGQERIEKSLRDQFAQGREETNRDAKLTREEIANSFKMMSESVVRNLSEMSTQHKGLLDSFAQQLTSLTQTNELKLEQLRDTLEKRLHLLQEDNSKKLDQMRATVDEKLHATLEKRLGESFKLVSDRLEQVHKGLGEMQTLASGVGDLKKVLTNVKTRGTLGEIQLDNILEQTLSSDLYERSAAVKKGSAERVDFVVKLPGKDEDEKQVLLPIDSKFPMEDYQRLLEAQESGDLVAANEAAKSMEMKMKSEAKSIQEKYIHPPNTTDFAIMFLPVEGLFAEILRRPGLWETLQREYRVVVTGPTTITALLNSLQMGFRTLTIQKRSSEVWKLLGVVKSEFGKFGDVLEKTQKKLLEASHTIDAAKTRSRAIERNLRSVEAVSAVESAEIFEEIDLVASE